MSEILAVLFLHPIQVPIVARLWLFLPLALCVAAVYRATRARTAAELPWATFITFINIVLAMVAIAAAAYILNVLVMYLS